MLSNFCTFEQAPAKPRLWLKIALLSVLSGGLGGGYAWCAPQQQTEVQRRAQIEQWVGKMVAIPGGRFRVGGTVLTHEKPIHNLSMAPFQMGAHEVTVGQFRTFVADSGGYVVDDDEECWAYESKKEKQQSGRSWRSPGFAQGDSHPAVCVSHDDAQAFIDWLNRKEGGSAYRLPTEAEWEYAARAGTTTIYRFGNHKDDSCRYANSADSNTGLAREYACSDGYKNTAPVGSLQPNGFGLYDMHGNVWEWVGGLYNKDYYRNSPVTDPQDSSFGEYCVIRSGSWNHNAGLLRSVHRFIDSPSYRSPDLGFRLVRQP